jgi:NADPH-dependent 2,4-dienoyl-CoA reductase/sulfur reductase-like enzyme/nitrite reductase/ring-hydroxylating ferredoxin subunit
MNDSKGLDFRTGVSLDQIPDGAIVAGHTGDEDLIVVRRGDQVFAVGAHCTHYHGPLAEGLVVGDTIRCPWHHACFSLRTGEAVRAPALDPIACWRVERRGNRVVVTEKRSPGSLDTRSPGSSDPGTTPRSVVIIGGGAAGLAAADMLRRRGFDGSLTMLSADAEPPVDRPNLSKDYLAGTAKDEWMPLRPPEFFTDNKIDLQLNARVEAIDITGRRVRLQSGATHAFDALLLATGAEPVRLTLDGTPAIPVHYLRTFADSRAIVASADALKSTQSKRALVMGASFIGLEVAASLRARGLDVHVVAPEQEPLVKVMGAEVGRFIRNLHESKGVVFHLGATVKRLDGRTATLSDASTIDVDLAIIGVGVRPNIALAEAAGLAMDRGVVVNEYLETSAPGIFAAGDIARWPDPHAGERIRVEHWVVAERQGQTAARNILGLRERFDAVPFFWSQHYDISINYVGHAESWDSAKVDGDLSAHDATVTYKKDGRVLAIATVFRDTDSLNAEAKMEASARKSD